MSCQTTHDWCADTTWEKLDVQIFWAPFATQLGLAVLVPLLGIKQLRFPLIPVAKNLETTPVFAVCYFLQGIFSGWVTWMWIARTYDHKVKDADRIIEIILSVYFIFHYFLLGARKGFIPSYPWEAASMIDAVTISSVFAAPAAKDATWLGLGYLRVSRTIIAWYHLERGGYLPEALGEFPRAVIGAILRTFALTVSLGGTVMVLEVLGDPEFIREKEKFITTNMGDLSFVQMFYWIFTTMSTVGYGDFSPTTVLSRFFVIFAIVSGILFFTAECDNVMTLQRDMGAGKGKYFPPFRGIKNVVVMGGGVAQPSALLSSFLEELYAAEHEFRIIGWPSCSLMSVVDCPEDIKDIISDLPEQGQQRVKYFMGNPMDPKDLERLRCADAELVFIIPNIGAADKVEEDEGNILRALAVKRTFPTINLRLAVLTPESLRKAINVGIKAERAFSLNEMKSSILSQSCICRGWTTFLTNLLTSSGIEDATGSNKDEELWVSQYRHGFNQSVYGFCADQSIVGGDGMPFGDLVLQCMGANVLPIALVGTDGRMLMSPLRKKVQKGDIVFAMASSNDDLDQFRDNRVVWQDVLVKLRQNMTRSSVQASNDIDISEKKGSSLRVSKRASKSGGFHMPWQSASGGQDAQEVITFGVTMERLDPELIKQCETSAEEIGKNGGHYVLVLLSTGLWQQVQSFIKALRKPQLTFSIPIVVLCPGGPPQAMATSYFAKDPSLGFIIGNPTRTKDLHRLNVQNARSVVLLAGQQAGGDVRMADSAGVIALTSIENMLMEAKSFAVPVLTEILNDESLHLLEPQPRWQVKPDAEEVAAKREAFYKHPRFASGGIFLMEALGGMIAQAYYTRGIIELFMELVVGFGQEYIPWQITLPPNYIGKHWRFIVTDFLGQSPPALPVGLYRPCEEGNVLGQWFMFTNPPIDTTTLCKEDLVIVLGNSDFGKKAYETKILATLFNTLAEQARSQWSQNTGYAVPATNSPESNVVGAADVEVEAKSEDNAVGTASTTSAKAAKKKPKATAKPKSK